MLSSNPYSVLLQTQNDCTMLKEMKNECYLLVWSLSGKRFLFFIFNYYFLLTGLQYSSSLITNFYSKNDTTNREIAMYWELSTWLDWEMSMYFCSNYVIIDYIFNLNQLLAFIWIAVINYRILFKLALEH